MEGHARRARKSGHPRQMPPVGADLTSRSLQSCFIPLKCYFYGLYMLFLPPQSPVWLISSGPQRHSGVTEVFYRRFRGGIRSRGLPSISRAGEVANGFYRRLRGPGGGSFFLPAGPTRRKSSSRRSISTRATATRTTSPRRNWLPRSRPERLCVVRS